MKKGEKRVNYKFQADKDSEEQEAKEAMPF